MIQKDGAQSFRDLYVPHGAQIIDIDILSMVFSLLRCTEVHCSGKLNLYQYAFRDGLQSYLLLKCSRCHLVLAEFPTSCPVGMKPNEAVNDPQMLCREKSEVNVRALLAVHCTSMSSSDFRLTCNLLDIQNTWHRKSLLAQLVHSTDKICQQSMSITAKEVRAKAESFNIPGCKVCAVSFDGSWHRRGHFSNQGFAGAIEVKTSLTTSSTNACVTNVSDGRKNVRKKTQRNTTNTGRNIRANAQLTSPEQVRRWNLLLQ